jgi:LPS-assembly protein
MKPFSAMARLLAVLLLAGAAAAQDAAPAPGDKIDVVALSHFLPGTVEGSVEFQPGGIITGTNGILVKYKGAALSADSATVNSKTGEVVADGHVRIESDDMLWVGEHLRYNFKTHQMTSEQFRTGKAPIFAGGAQLTGDRTANVYTATDAFVTTDDISDPDVRIRSSRIRIVPGKSLEMWNAVLLVHGVPVFYFPYYHRSLGAHANHFTVHPGFRSTYGAFLLTTYEWYLGDVAEGKIHADYRSKRGGGVGPDVDLHLGQWGDFRFRYYYVNDNRANTSTNNLPYTQNIPRNRQRFLMDWQATPATNFNVKAQVNYDSDPLVLHDFFDGDYTANPQPNTFVEANKYWDNWSLDALTSPEINNYFDQVERLPDVQLTGFRQQVFETPFYYDSQSSVGYFRKFFAETNAPGFNVNSNYSAARLDTYHQITLPWTFFDWLNVAPRVGGRWTYYGSTDNPLSPYNEHYRTVFNTGIGTSFKVARLWEDATNSMLQVDGLRHIMEPSANYVYVPNPSTPPALLPQFDTERPGLMLSPVDFPDYNSIDSVDSQNVIRFGLRNTLQTKRDGQIENLLDWNLLLDWRLAPNSTQSTFNDLYSALEFRPRTWLAMQSQVRYAPNSGQLNMAFHQIQFMPNDRWSWGLGHWYLRSNFLGYGEPGNNYLTSTIFYRVNDNWGLRATHDFNAQEGRLQQQYYTVYRDLRSWTAAISFRVADNSVGETDYSVAFSFSIKAQPSTHVGDDTVRPDHLLTD